MLETILITALKRPYVVGFLIAYLLIASRFVSPRFAILHLLSGYTIAFASEWGAINHGFPYGWYHYIYENLQGEWLNHGVPVWDSASYAFMSFAGLAASRYFLRHSSKTDLKYKLKLILFSALFTTLLDVVVDPVAHLGEKWFLGKIYYYPHPGFYFDVTLANFAGWLLTTFCINAVAVLVWKFCEREKLSSPYGFFFSLGLYFGIFFFGMGIAVYLGETAIVLADSAWIMLAGMALKCGFLLRNKNHFPTHLP